MPHFDRIILYFDGASRSNPTGPAGCGWKLYEMDAYGADGCAIAEGYNYLGYNVSNNQAEYRGLETGLRCMYHAGITCNSLFIRGDSEIVINQLAGIYEVRSPNIVPYFRDVQTLLGFIRYDVVHYRHVARNRNYEADSFANQAIDVGGHHESYLY